MKKRFRIFFGLFFLSVGILFAQDTSHNELVEDYLEANSSLDQYEFAYDQLLQMLSNQYPKSETNAQGWKFLNENKEKAMADMKSMLVPIYQSNFTQEDIVEMTSFYKTETGQQLVKDRTKMSEEQKRELNSYYNTEVGQKIVEKQSLLSKSISQASENWSRDLYETAVSILKGE